MYTMWIAEPGVRASLHEPRLLRCAAGVIKNVGLSCCINTPMYLHAVSPRLRLRYGSTESTVMYLPSDLKGSKLPVSRFLVGSTRDSFHSSKISSHAKFSEGVYCSLLSPYAKGSQSTNLQLLDSDLSQKPQRQDRSKNFTSARKR